MACQKCCALLNKLVGNATGKFRAPTAKNWQFKRPPTIARGLGRHAFIHGVVSTDSCLLHSIPTLIKNFTGIASHRIRICPPVAMWQNQLRRQNSSNLCPVPNIRFFEEGRSVGWTTLNDGGGIWRNRRTTTSTMDIESSPNVTTAIHFSVRQGVSETGTVGLITVSYHLFPCKAVQAVLRCTMGRRQHRNWEESPRGPVPVHMHVI